jgi:hypothetical protein
VKGYILGRPYLLFSGRLLHSSQLLTQIPKLNVYEIEEDSYYVRSARSREYIYALVKNIAG